eukprot:gene26149-32685_t
MKPGDLIFYEGKYNSSRSKSQKHNNVHVEIFLGGETGEATIGSRYHKGNVSIFPSYKFKSTTWELVQFHFRSLDTWLDGLCRSCCEEHLWQSDSLNYVEAAGRRSIFSEEQDQSAGGEDEDEVVEEGDSGAATNTSNDATAASVTIDTAPSTVNAVAGDVTLPSPDTKPKSDPPQPLSLDDLICPNDNLPTVTPKDSTNSTKTRRKSNNDTSKDSVSSPTPSTAGGGAGGVGSLKVEGAKLPKRSEVKKQQASAESPSAKIKETSRSMNSIDGNKSAKITSKDIPRTYYVGKTNGCKLVKAAMDKRGWAQLPFEYQFSNRYGLKWVERRSDIDYRSHVAGQMVCHIPNNDIITTKIGILSVLRDKFCKQPIGSGVKIHAPWIPQTYDLDTPSDCIALIQAANDCVAATTAAFAAANSSSGGGDPTETPVAPSEGTTESAEVTPNATTINTGITDETITAGIWIYKPSQFNRGRGIKVLTGVEALKEICYGKQTGDPETTIAPMKGIVQKYIENPLLVGPQRLKFDIRCYMLIARNHPTTLAFYHPGYCRLALKPYDISTVSSLNDTSVHLTNASIQKKGDLYEANKELQIQSVLSVASTIEAQGAPLSAQYLRHDLDNEIKLCMVDVLKASNHKLLRKHGFFDLLGCDFMLGDDNKLYLLEINTNPALSLDNSTLEALLPGVVDGAIELVLGSQGPDSNNCSNDAALLQNLPQSYQLIFNEQSGSKHAIPEIYFTGYLVGHNFSPAAQNWPAAGLNFN